MAIPLQNPKFPFSFIFIFIIIIIIFIFSSSLMAESSTCSNSDGPIKPSTPLISFLQRLQSTALKTLGPTNFDPKLYVDLPLKSDLSTVEASFDKLPRSPNGSVAARDLDGFIEQHLEGAGRDLVAAKPGDFVPVTEGFLPKVKSKEVRAWALEVHSLWKNLSRKVSDKVKGRPGLHTLLPLPGRVVIPGSRFREVYYWDSYWVISVHAL